MVIRSTYYLYAFAYDPTLCLVYEDFYLAIGSVFYGFIKDELNVFALWVWNGGMAEWLKAAVLKTVVPRGTVGSNPTPSATV